MKIYLLLACVLLAANSHNCQQVGQSSLANLTACAVSSPPPQLKWTINITLLQDYDWRGAEEVRYYYMNMKDEIIQETCYQGQTIKGKYSKGSSLLVEQLCFDFKPSISKGDKLYLMIFWDKSATQKQVIYLSFTANGDIEESGAVAGEELVRLEEKIRKNLVSE
jgi:hypothetical protein